MPGRGRPRLSIEELQARVAAYCARYRVAPSADGLPPFPTGRRETRQHREWIAVYKAHDRLGRRARGQCERCSAPAVENGVFCEQHTARTGPRARLREALLASQAGRCPICAQTIDPRDGVGHARSGLGEAVLDGRCRRLVDLAEALGPKGLGRLRDYLWPARPRKGRPTAGS